MVAKTDFVDYVYDSSSRLIPPILILLSILLILIYQTKDMYIETLKMLRYMSIALVFALYFFIIALFGAIELKSTWSKELFNFQNLDSDNRAIVLSYTLAWAFFLLVIFTLLMLFIFPVSTVGDFLFYEFLFVCSVIIIVAVYLKITKK